MTPEDARKISPPTDGNEILKRIKEKLDVTEGTNPHVHLEIVEIPGTIVCTLDGIGNRKSQFKSISAVFVGNDGHIEQLASCLEFVIQREDRDHPLAYRSRKEFWRTGLKKEIP